MAIKVSVIEALGVYSELCTVPAATGKKKGEIEEENSRQGLMTLVGNLWPSCRGYLRQSRLLVLTRFAETERMRVCTAIRENISRLIILLAIYLNFEF
jgi:hypothetical protein